MAKNEKSKTCVETILLQQMEKYLRGEITKEEYAIITEEFYTKYGHIIEGTKFYEAFSENIPDCCLINVDEPGNEDGKEREFLKTIRDIYEQLINLPGKLINEVQKIDKLGAAGQKNNQNLRKDFSEMKHEYSKSFRGDVKEILAPGSIYSSGGQWRQYSLEKERAKQLLDVIIDPFRNYEFGQYCTDVGTWTLRAYNTDDEEFKYEGCLISECFKEAEAISYEVRNELRSPDLYVFDGQDGFDSIDYIYLSVEFSDGGKTYYYLTEDETIRIGDFVKVPVRDSELKIVKVVDIEKFKGNQVPMPIESVKHIIGKMTDMNIITENDVIEAHVYSSNNKLALLKDSRCGCFYCLKIFDPKEIEEYLEDDNELDKYGTAECPYCGIDSIIPESSGYPITEEFLKRMYRYWFGSGTGVTLISPLGKLELLKDGKPVGFFHNSIDPNAELFPDVDEIQRLEYDYVSDGKPHTLSFVVKGENIKGTVESGEVLEAISFYQDKCKLTLGCVASFGDYKEYHLDYDGYYCDEGIVITILPETKSQVFKFGACWLSNYSDENDNQTWFGADPTI